MSSCLRYASGLPPSSQKSPHGFDDEGRNYDAKGKFESAGGHREDSAKFEQRADMDGALSLMRFEPLSRKTHQRKSLSWRNICGDTVEYFWEIGRFSKNGSNTKRTKRWRFITPMAAVISMGYTHSAG